jgi:soluble lytic murein transglycosylase
VVGLLQQSVRIFLLVSLLLAGIVSPQTVSKTQTPTKKPTVQRKATKVATKPRRRSSPRVRRMHQAFVASSDLKPMARQLLQDRTPAAYAGVEAYARKHTKEDAGALAWLVLGYARMQDNDWPKTIDALNRAKPMAGDLGDYVDYNLASAYFQSGRKAETIVILGDFDTKYPDSILLRDVHVQYANAVLADGRPGEAVAILEKYRLPIRADIELTLGRAYAASNQGDKAAIALRNLYLTMPVSPEAAQAQAELKKIELSGVKVSPPTTGESKIRADLLFRGKQYAEAATEYQSLLLTASEVDRPAIQLAYGVALNRADRDRDAKRVLDALQGLTPDQDAERYYNLATIARSQNDEAAVVKYTDQVRTASAQSSSLEQALLLTGNMFLVKPDYDRAIDAYRELATRFPTGAQGPYAHWKVAWLSLRMGRNADAKREFEQQIALYPTSAQVPAALYWRARLAEEDSDIPTAQAYYQKVSDRFRNYYYGELARQRLKQIKTTDDVPQIALLDHVPPISGSSKVTLDEIPTDNLRVQKAELLANGALLDLAINELQAAATEEKGNWLTAEIARLYQEAGRPDMALRMLKRAVPTYFAVDLPALPRPYWEGLFPRPYWTDLKKYSSNNALDPFLVASLIRQESEFNPNAVSRANAVGLMQLLPKVGKGVAKQEKIKHFTPQALFTPDMNMRLGTRYFRAMVDKFGAFEYALAAYNAGSDRVETWMNYGKYRDPQEFVESIPFTETREYVQAILRNESVYKQLYGTP